VRDAAVVQCTVHASAGPLTETPRPPARIQVRTPLVLQADADLLPSEGLAAGLSGLDAGGGGGCREVGLDGMVQMGFSCSRA
jgi:hypothetical protein